MLTPAFPADLPPLGELVTDDPFWRYPSAALPGEGVAHLRVWLTTGPEPGPAGRRHRNRPVRVRH